MSKVPKLTKDQKVELKKLELEQARTRSPAHLADAADVAIGAGRKTLERIESQLAVLLAEVRAEMPRWAAYATEIEAEHEAAQGAFSRAIERVDAFRKRHGMPSQHVLIDTGRPVFREGT